MTTTNEQKIAELESKLDSLDSHKDFWQCEVIKDELSELRSADCDPKMHFKKIIPSGGSDYCFYCGGKS